MYLFHSLPICPSLNNPHTQLHLSAVQILTHPPLFSIWIQAYSWGLQNLLRSGCAFRWETQITWAGKCMWPLSQQKHFCRIYTKASPQIKVNLGDTGLGAQRYMQWHRGCCSWNRYPCVLSHRTPEKVLLVHGTAWNLVTTAVPDEQQSLLGITC